MPSTNFTFGYSMAPSFIVGTYVSLANGLEEGFRIICPHAIFENGFHQVINKYVVTHLPGLFEDVRKNLSFPVGFADNIFALCDSQPLFTNRYYLAGVAASRLNFHEAIELLKTSFSPTL